MDSQRQTLPLLLDLTSSPSYTASKPSSHRQRKLSKNSSVPYSIGSSTMRGFSHRKESNSPSHRMVHTVRTSQKTSEVPPMKEDQHFHFTQLKSLPKNLPKLYTGPQYELLLQKKNKLKEKYQRLYQNVQDGEDPQALPEILQEDLKELMQEAEQIFHQTYSIKYFGVKDNQLGIVSKRVPIARIDSNFADNGKPQSRKRLEQCRSVSAQNMVKPLNSFREGSDQNLGNELQSQTDSNYVVTQYFAPKKLESVKVGEKNTSNKSKNKVGNPWELHSSIHDKVMSEQGEYRKSYSQHFSQDVNKIWDRVAVSNQQVANTADFSRKITSVGKTKRAILRSVNLEKAWESKPFKDELDVPERFRTHEVKKVMAGQAKYSYSKLLKTMYSNEKPETVLIENTEKMERILAMRGDGRHTARPVMGSDDPYQHGPNGNYIVKVMYPKENEMFNRFVKIRSNVEKK